MANASPCATRRSTIRTARACAARAWIAAGSRANHCLRDDAAGVWQCVPLPALGAAKPEVGGAHALLPRPDDPRAAALAPSLVGVALRHAVLGVRHHRAQLPRHRPRGRRRSAGSSWSIATPCRSRWATCASPSPGRSRFPGKVEFVHPLHNLAIVSYDPKLIGNDAGAQREAARPANRRPVKHSGSSASTPRAN